MSLENPIETQACHLVWTWLGIEGSKLSVLGNTGYPDRIFWLPQGHPLLIEFKRMGVTTVAPKQQEIHERLIGLGYVVQVHNDAVEAFSAVIRELENMKLPPLQYRMVERARRRCKFLEG